MVGYLIALFLGVGLLAALPLGGVIFLAILLLVGVGNARDGRL